MAMTLDLEQCASPTEKASVVMEYMCTKLMTSITIDALKYRVDNLIAHFKKNYGIAPIKVIRVPGRVNLIGEHVDYCGFPVCPMAMDSKDVLMAVGMANDPDAFLKLNNVEGNKYPDYVIKNYERKLSISLKEQGWAAYVLCGIQGFIDHMLGIDEHGAPKGFYISVCGNIPPAAGLSSSSALVCAGFLAAADLNELLPEMSKIEISTLCATAEHYIGTAGGGMDQAIAINGKRGSIKLVKFNPLRVKDVTLPGDPIVMVANSLTTTHKAASNDFNIRVVECRIAGQILAKVGGIEDWRNLTKLATVKRALDCSFPEIFSYIDKVLHNNPYSKEEICDVLAISPDELDDISLTPDTRNVSTFKLKQRALHVFGEAERVHTWRNWCNVGKSLDDLGTLMQRSHSSLQQLYECSHPDVDKIVSIFTLSGAHGARLTGAGWGGSVVALVPRKQVDPIFKTLNEMYYKSMKIDLDTALFTVTPGEGAEIFLVE